VVTSDRFGLGVCVVTARSELRKVLFLAPSVCGVFFVYEISREPLNGFAPNSHGRLVWFLAGTSLKAKVKGQGHKGQKNGIFRPFRWPACGLFGKTSLASSLHLLQTFDHSDNGVVHISRVSSLSRTRL